MAARNLFGLAVAAAVLAALVPSVASASAPAVGFSATTVDFGSSPWLVAAPIQTLTITNTGDAPLTVSAVDDTGEQYVPVDFIVLVGGCPGHTRAPGDQCQEQLRFTPQSGGPRSTTLSVFDNAADSPQHVSLIGRGTGAVVRFTPDALQFLDVPVGTTSAPKTFSAVNAGDAPVTISAVALSPSPALSRWFAITADKCTGATLAPGQRCGVSATVTPDAVATAIQQVYFTDNAGTGQQVYDFDKSVDGLQAAGAGPLLDAGEPIPAFVQDVGTTSAASRVTVRDAGTAQLAIAGVGIDDLSFGLSIAADTCTGANLVVDTLFTPPSRCYVDVVFAPTFAGSFQANLVFHDNEFGGTHDVLLRAAGVAPAAELSPAAVDFGFEAVGVPSMAHTVMLTNPTNQALTVSGLSLGGSSPTAFSATNDSCSNTTVAAGHSCSVGVVFQPSFPYLFAATLAFATNAARPVQPISLRGEGQSPTFSISASTLQFGNLRARTASKAQTVTVTNTSAGPLTFGLLSTNASLATAGCAGQVAAGDSCQLTVTVTPSGEGPDSGLLKIFDQAFNQQLTEAGWYGIGGDPSIVNTLGTSILQRVGDTLTGYVLLIDGGLDSLQVGQATVSANPVVTMTADGCSNQLLTTGTRCVITLVASPQAAGRWSATLSIPTDAPVGSNSTTVAFGGLASAPRTPLFSPSAVSFAAQRIGGPEATQVVWFVSGGTVILGALPISVSSVAVAGPDAASFRVAWDGCSGLEVSPAYSCAVEVGFDPARGGSLNASLLFNDDGAGSPQAVALSGTGLAPATQISPPAVDFGNVILKSKSGPITVTVTNVGNFTMHMSRETVSGPAKGDYTMTSETCQNQALVPGASCQVVLVFRPSALGTRSATLAFTDDAVDSPQAVPLTGTGVAK
jgi:hypothetical protein